MTGQGKENVVEIGGVDGDLLGLDRGFGEPIQQVAQRFRAAVAGDAQGQRAVVAGGAGQAARRRIQFLGLCEAKLDVAAGHQALEVVGCAFGDDAPLVEYRDPVGQMIGFLEVLGGEEDRHTLGCQLPHDVPHGAPAARIQSGGRLVEEDYLRFGDQRHRQIQLPAHTAGVGRRPLTRGLHQIEPLQQFGHHPLARIPAQPMQSRHQPQVLLPRQQVVHRRELPGHPDRRPDGLTLGGEVVAGDPSGPPVGLRQRGQYVHGRRLPGPVRAEQRKDRPGLDGQIDPVEDRLVPVRLPQPGGGNCCAVHGDNCAVGG